MDLSLTGFKKSLLKDAKVLVLQEESRSGFFNFLQKPIGKVVLSGAAVLVTSIIAYLGFISALVFLLILAGIPLLVAVIAYPKFGTITLLIAAYLIMWIDKMFRLPLGVAMDGLELLLIIGFFIRHKYDKTWGFIKSPISIIILIWLIYNCLEFVNPIAESRIAWVYTVRTVAIVMLTYFIFMYNITSVKFIRLIIKIWIALSLFGALYCIWQEYFGFLGFEKKYLADDPGASALYFIGGHWRKFSIFSDPVSCAYNMVISSVLCITLMFGNTSLFKKITLGFLTSFFVMAMLYTGTRGAFILIPAALALLFVLKLNRQMLIVGVVFAIIMAFLIKMPTSNGTLLRFQSAFMPSSDASYNVRKQNQKKIQPYIQSHPIGGGLGSTGVWGQRFSPNSYLASFPPDSGYVRVAVETGWIGLFLICTLMFVVLKTGIDNYFKIQNLELKNYCLAMVLIVFVLNIGNFPQEALVQFPVNIYFYLVIALINITLNLDKKITGTLITVNQ